MLWLIGRNLSLPINLLHVREGGGIPRRDIFGMPSSATCLETVRILKEKDDEKKDKETATASKEMTNNKKAIKRPPSE